MFKFLALIEILENGLFSWRMTLYKKGKNFSYLKAKRFYITNLMIE
jgi:hypothetical protein